MCVKLLNYHFTDKSLCFYYTVTIIVVYCYYFCNIVILYTNTVVTRKCASLVIELCAVCAEQLQFVKSVRISGAFTINWKFFIGAADAIPREGGGGARATTLSAKGLSSSARTRQSACGARK